MSVEERAYAASRATYTGSPEHKALHARSDATLCPADLNAVPEELTRHLRKAIEQGKIGGVNEGGFPRYVWYFDGARVFEGRLTNQVNGEYKGYPIGRDEAPKELQG